MGGRTLGPGSTHHSWHIHVSFERKPPKMVCDAAKKDAIPQEKMRCRKEKMRCRKKRLRCRKRCCRRFASGSQRYLTLRRAGDQAYASLTAGIRSTAPRLPRGRARRPAADHRARRWNPSLRIHASERPPACGLEVEIDPGRGSRRSARRSPELAVLNNDHGKRPPKFGSGKRPFLNGLALSEKNEGLALKILAATGWKDAVLHAETFRLMIPRSVHSGSPRQEEYNSTPALTSTRHYPALRLVSWPLLECLAIPFPDVNRYSGGVRRTPAE
jgi:hypothetical protein